MPVEGGLGRSLQETETGEADGGDGTAGDAAETADDEAGAGWADDEEDDDSAVSTDNAADETERRDEFYEEHGAWPGDPTDDVNDSAEAEYYAEHGAAEFNAPEESNVDFAVELAALEEAKLDPANMDPAVFPAVSLYAEQEDYPLASSRRYPERTCQNGAPTVEVT